MPAKDITSVSHLEIVFLATGSPVLWDRKSWLGLGLPCLTALILNLRVRPIYVVTHFSTSREGSDQRGQITTLGLRRCREVLSLENIGNSTPRAVQTQWSTLMLWIVWARSELQRAMSIHVFRVSCFIVSLLFGNQDFKKFNTLLTSQVTEYLFIVGLIFLKDFSNLLTFLSLIISP